MTVTKTTQLIVNVPNQTGQLAAVLKAVGAAGVNILAYAGYVEGGQGTVILVTEDNATVAGALKGAGMDVQKRPVVVVRADDVVGAGAGLSEKIAAAGVSLVGAYATAAGGEYVTVYWADDVDALAAALQ